jgi:hypothetical protein
MSHKTSEVGVVVSRSRKRNFPAAVSRIDEEGGRVPVIRKEPDCRVSHSHDCYMCEQGTTPKRLMHIKPRRRREQRDLRAAIEDDYGLDEE